MIRVPHTEGIQITEEHARMNRDLISLVQRQMPDFSKGQRLIGQYIIDHYDKAAFMTASKLGATVGVSESTVVR